jgi:hypothetical protein
LFVEPGSNTSVSGRLCSVAVAGSAGWPGTAGVVAVAGTGSHVCGDRDAAVRVGRVDLVDERALGLVLDRLVERQHEIRAAACRLDRARRPRERDALRVAFDDLGSGPARELLLVTDLEPAEPVVVEADETEDRGGKGAGGIEALRLG